MNIRILFTAILLTIASVAHADKWTEILDTYATDTTTHQIVLVKCTEGCNAEAEFYIKDAQQHWQLERADTAHIGRYGLGKNARATRKHQRATSEYVRHLASKRIPALPFHTWT